MLGTLRSARNVLCAPCSFSTNNTVAHDDFTYGYFETTMGIAVSGAFLSSGATGDGGTARDGDSDDTRMDAIGV